MVNGEVWIDPEPPYRDEGQHWRRRLEEGLEHNIRLVIAKSVLGLQSAGADYREALEIRARFGTTYSANGWGAAMSILTCTANILPRLHEEDRPRALYQGLLHVSRECAGKAPRFPVEPLPTGETRPEVFKRWFRNFIDVRDDEGAERCLVTAIELGISRDDIADMIFAAATDHIYLDGGACGGLRQQGLRAAGPPGLGDGRAGAAQSGARDGGGRAEARNSASGASPSIWRRWCGRRGRSCQRCWTRDGNVTANGTMETRWRKGC